MDLRNKKIAIVCDWIKDWGGAEIVLEQFLDIFPQADIFTSVFWQQGNPVFKGRKVNTSFIQNIPFLNKSHKLALTLRPIAFESFDLSAYDIVISSSSAESKGVITKPGCLHICYCHTPTRYFWSHYHEYRDMMEFGVFNFLAKFLMPRVINNLRKWDFCAGQRPDFFIANSENTRRRIKKYYGRDSLVIYPCLDISKIDFIAPAKTPIIPRLWDKKKVLEEEQEYYFYASRVIPYKKFDLIVEAFNKNGKALKIVANTKNKLSEELRKKSSSNIEWVYETDNKVINKLHSKAKAFLFPPEEDFGLAPIAAMATGTPVIAYGKGGALETIIPPPAREGARERGIPTGIFFEKQTSNSLNKAIEKFEELSFDSKAIREYSMKFDKSVFRKNILEFVEKKMRALNN